MDRKLVFQISEINGFFIGILYSISGICWNTLPVKSKKIINPPIQILNQSNIINTTEDEKGYAMIIYELHCDPLSSWEDSLSVPIDMGDLSVKTQRVLNTLRKIKPGKTVTYGELGEKSNLINSARFIGTCMRKNYTPLLIPCHRVLPASGKLGAYSAAGGTTSKARYLTLEGASYKS